MGKWSKQIKAQGGLKTFAPMRTAPMTQQDYIEAKEDKTEEAVITNTLWGAGCKYSTQAEYQRSCMGSKWSTK